MSRRLELTFVVVLLILGVLLKVWFVQDVTGGDFGKVRFSDEATYYLPAAREISEQGFSYFLTERSLWNGPLNPLWIYALGSEPSLVKAANILLIALAGLLVWVMLRERSKTSALWALFAWNIYPPLIDFGPTLLTEPPYLFLLTLGAFLFYRERTFSCGLIWGAATLVRPTTQLLPVLLILAAFFPYFKASRAKLLKVALGILIVITPYIVKNYFVFGRPTIANGFGAVFQLGTNLRTYGDEPIYYGIDFDTQRYTKEYTHLDSEGDKRLTQAAIEYVTKHPIASLWLAVIKPFKLILGHTRHYFFPYNGLEAFLEYERDLGRIWMTFGALVLTPFVTLIGLIGIFRRIKAQPLAALLVLYFLALHTVVFPIPRMALPLFSFLLFGAATTSRIERIWGAAAATVFILLVSFGMRGKLSHEYCSSYPSYFEERFQIETSNPVSSQDVEEVNGVFKVVGKDPFVVFKADAPTDRNQLVLIELEVLNPPKRGQELVWGQLFWSEHDKFSEGQSTPFLFRTATGLSRYRVSVTFNPMWHKVSNIRNIRLDLGERVRGMVLKMKHIEIVG